METLQQADIILAHGIIVTCDRDDAVVPDGAVAISGNAIAGVGPTAEILARFAPVRVIDATHRAIMPGLINTHTHGPMTLFRGLADDLPLGPWLKRMADAADRVIARETVQLGAELAYIEMLRGGTTTAVDMYFFPEALAAAAAHTGLRVMTGPVFVAHEVTDRIPASERLAHGREFMQAYRHDPLVMPCVMPHSPHDVPAEQLVQARQLAEEYAAPVSLHTSETRADVARVVAEQGTRPIEYLERLGLLSPRTILAHGIHIDAHEIECLARHGATVAHCPVSNLKLADGVAPVPEMLRAGITVTLGTDGPASSNDLDLWNVLRLTAILHRGIREDAQLTPARQVIRMATVDAAAALGLADRLGSLEKGKLADLILVDLDRPHLVPLYDIHSHLAYAAGRADVDTVIVNGRIVLNQGRLQTIDEADTMARVREVGRRIAP